QYITQDPKYPDRFWMTGMFTTDIMECVVDFDKKDWHVRAVYDAKDDMEKAIGGLLFLPGEFISDRFHPPYHDLDGDGKPERLIWWENTHGMLMKLDEENGKLIPIAASGFIQDPEFNMLQGAKPTELQAKKYATLMKIFALQPKGTPTARYWS